MSMTFAQPQVLALLVAVPLLGVLGWRFGVLAGRLPRSAFWLRLAVVALVVVGLAEPLVAAGGGGASTVYVVDRSRSLPDESARAANAWIGDRLAGAAPGDRAAVVTFGADPVLAAPAAEVGQLSPDWANQGAEGGPNRDYTDISSALALARALPLGGARRIVLLSDGAENVGSALDQAAQATGDGVPIDVVPLDGVGEGDLRLAGTSAPESAWFGEPVTVLASVSTGAGGPGQLEIWVDGERWDEQAVELPDGLSSHAFKLSDLPAGFHTVEVRVSGAAASDRLPQNNSAPMALVVREAPRILLVAPPDADPGRLRAALAATGAEIGVVAPAAVPSRLSDLAAYDAFVLDNVAAGALSLDQLAGLREATRSYGRGMVVVGGTTSYGPGGYAGTLLEDALPVTVRVTDGRQRQRVALLLIMDKSGSMSYDPLGGSGKIEMAKEAVRLAARSLAEGDEVGVIVFNDKQEWAVPLTPIEGEPSRAQIDRRVAAIGSDGGTEILPALAAGLDAIRNVEADVRHIVLLSDGKSRTGTRESYQKLIDDAVGDRVTLSTIAIGQDADTDLLNFLADQGGGRYHFTERAEEIPEVTLEEAQSAGSQAVIRGEFPPIQTAPSPILAAFEPEELPALDGYDFAEAKPDAQVVLASDRDDPILAKWQYGLGRVVAWTADDGVDLAARWPSWERYDEFWAATVRWALPDPENRPLSVDVRRDGTQAVVTVAAAGGAGATAGTSTDLGGFAETTAVVTSPSGAASPERTLAQTGPGEFQLRVDAPEPGAYRIDVRQVRGGGAVAETAGFAVPPSPELQPAPGADALLQAVAARTGGQVLSIDDPAALADGRPSGTPLRDYRPLWSLPLALALAGLVAEVAIRMGIPGVVRGWLASRG